MPCKISALLAWNLGHPQRIQSIFLNAYPFIIEGLPFDSQARGWGGVSCAFVDPDLEQLRLQTRRNGNREAAELGE
jgi:hypothetical protein